jgi:GNAT superfamily N-acetyltransferase
MSVEAETLAHHQALDAHFTRELAHDLWPEIMPLLEAHKREVAHYPDIRLEVDVEAYNLAEESGCLRCYTARVAGRLVGYLVLFVRANLHYRQSVQAVQDVLFVVPAFRITRVPTRLIAFAEAQLRCEGVQVLYQHMKAARHEEALMQMLGYTLIDHIWGKRLDREEG